MSEFYIKIKAFLCLLAFIALCVFIYDATGKSIKDYRTLETKYKIVFEEEPHLNL